MPSQSSKTPLPQRVGVVGAGVSGVATAAHLRAAGIDVVVFERASVSGGVWYEPWHFILFVITMLIITGYTIQIRHQNHNTQP